MQFGSCAAVVILAAVIGYSALSTPATAQRLTGCRPGTTNVSGFGCVPDSAIRQAKQNCLRGPAKTHNWTQCLCQDGATVGACGD